MSCCGLLQLKSPYNIPHGNYVNLCGTDTDSQTDTEEWVTVEGNEISLVWTQSANASRLSDWWAIVAYRVVELEGKLFSTSIY